MKRIGTTEVAGVTYTIHLVAQHERLTDGEALTEDAFGHTDHGNRSILLLESMPSDRFQTILLHEILHAAVFESGAYEQLKRSINVSGAKPLDVEECLVTTLAPTLAGALVSLGWKPPTFPKKAK